MHRIKNDWKNANTFEVEFDELHFIITGGSCGYACGNWICVSDEYPLGWTTVMYILCSSLWGIVNLTRENINQSNSNIFNNQIPIMTRT